jgi:epoxide hydrolase
MSINSRQFLLQESTSASHVFLCLQALADYWQTTFSWKAQEALLNRYKQFTVPVHGINMHFVHERSSNPDAIPLVFIHGWPGSFFEVYKVLPMLLAGMAQPPK